MNMPLNASVNDTSEQPPVGWVLYDESCGICRSWVPRWRGTFHRAGFEIAPLQAEWIRTRIGIAEDESLRDFRILFVDGRQCVGADAYRALMRRIWWARPLAWVASIWPISLLFDLAYRCFANNRHRISQACGMNSAGDTTKPMQH